MLLPLVFAPLLINIHTYVFYSDHSFVNGRVPVLGVYVLFITRTIELIGDK